MPVPDLSGVPPWAEFEDLKNKINDIVAKYNNLLVNLDSLNVVSLTADHIDAGTIDANIVTIRSDLTAGAYIQIDGNGMAINNGTYNTFTADISGMVTMTGATIRNNLSAGFIQLNNTGMVINNGSFNTFTASSNGFVTMTGALIQSANGYPRVVMDPDTQLFGAYLNPSNYVEIQADFNGVPSLNIWQNGGIRGRINAVTGSMEINANGFLDIISSNNMSLRPSNILYIPPFTRVMSSNGQNLGAELDDKALAGISTGDSGMHNHGIADGTVLMTQGGGTVTFFAVGNHTHEQNS